MDQNEASEEHSSGEESDDRANRRTVDDKEERNEKASSNHTEEKEDRGWVKKGRKIGDYVVRGKIGEGAMAEVYKAYDEKLDRNVALKILSLSSKAGGGNRKQRFVREARSAASLTHSNVVQVFSAGQDDDLIYIAMEYVEGETLTEKLERRGRFPVEEALYVVKKIAEALATAHESDIIHRDVKPSNILFDSSGEPKIADFGLARTLNVDQRLTQSGAFLGTPSYCSPEQCEKQDVDSRTDLYSLGVVLFEMLTGELPHDEESVVTTMRKICEEDPPDPRSLNSDIPSPVSRFVERLLAKKPEHRYESAGVVVQLTQELLRNPSREPSTEIADSVSGSVTRNTSGLNAKQMFVTAGIIVLILSCGLFGAFYISRDSGSDRDTAARVSRAEEDEPEESGIEGLREEPVIIASLNFENATETSGKAWIKNAIPDLLHSKLHEIQGFEFVPQETILDRYQRSDLFDHGSKNVSDDFKLTLNDTSKQLLRKEGVELFLAGEYFLSGENNKRVRIQAKLFYLLPDEGIEYEATVSTQGSSDEFFKVIDEMTKDLMKTLKKADTGLLGPQQFESIEKLLDSCEIVLDRNLGRHLLTFFYFTDNYSFHRFAEDWKNKDPAVNIEARLQWFRNQMNLTDGDQGKRYHADFDPSRQREGQIQLPGSISKEFFRLVQKNQKGLTPKEKRKMAVTMCMANMFRMKGKIEKFKALRQKVKTNFLGKTLLEKMDEWKERFDEVNG